MKSLYRVFVLPFLIALQFLTIIPIRLLSLPTTKQNALSLLFYPIVGLILGEVLWAVATYVALPVMLLSCLIMALWVWLTGGLHLDGLADTADGWVGGYGDRERTLAIMKDSHTGAIGVLAIVVVLAVKWSSIYSLLELGAVMALLIVPMLGRLTVLCLFITTPYVSKNGLGSALAQADKPLTAGVAAVFVLLGLMVFSLKVALGLAIAWLLFVLILRHLFIKRLNGITGDTVGASIEIIEAGLLVVTAGLSYS